VKTRTWARGVTTTYDYYDTGVAPFTGELKSITYSDATPDVSYSYTRTGAIGTVTDAAGTRTVNYGADLLPDTEAFDASFYGAKTLTYNFDGAGRATGYSYNGASTVSATIGYDAATGRPSSIAGALGATSVSFTPTYATGTDWVSSMASGASYVRTTPLASTYDVIASATTKWGTTTLGQFKANYSTTTGWRTGQDSGATSAAAAGSWMKRLDLGDGVKAGTAVYDGYGQLTGTGTPTWQATAGTQALNTRALSWTYDLAGNRKTEGEAGGAATTYSTSGTNPKLPWRRQATMHHGALTAGRRRATDRGVAAIVRYYSSFVFRANFARDSAGGRCET
jgi:hypothetical protein